MSETVGHIEALLNAHGVSGIIENDWVVPNSQLPALRALWHPGQSSGRLDVQALVGEGVLIEECFGGLGEGEAALQDALANFSVNSLHVLLAALWERNDPEQVATEQWEVNGKRYTAYIGNFGTRSSAGAHAHIPHDLFPAIESSIKAERLTGEIHWFRLFFGNVANSFTFEALRDNETWDGGLRCLENAGWKREASYYSVRLFVVLRAA